MSESNDNKPKHDPHQGFRFRCILWLGICVYVLVLATITALVTRDWGFMIFGACMAVLVLICWPINERMARRAIARGEIQGFAERRVANAKLSASFGNMFGILALIPVFFSLMELLGDNKGEAIQLGALALFILLFASLLRWLGR